MTEAELLRELSQRTGLPESAAELVLRGLRDLVHEGDLEAGEVLAARPEAVAAPLRPPANPEDPRLVEDLIARARRHPLGVEFLLSGLLGSVAIALGVHAFTVEAARRRLRKEEAAKESEPEAILT